MTRPRALALACVLAAPLTGCTAESAGVRGRAIANDGARSITSSQKQSAASDAALAALVDPIGVVTTPSELVRWAAQFGPSRPLAHATSRAVDDGQGERYGAGISIRTASPPDGALYHAGRWGISEGYSRSTSTPS